MLLVAGGSFWTSAPWEGGSKHYSDKIFGLSDVGGEWKSIGALPVPLAYAAFAMHDGELYIAGGENAEGILRTAYRVSVTAAGARIIRLADLPFPLVNGCGAFLGDVFYVCCGQAGKSLDSATGGLWSFEGGKWVEQAALPASPRILPIFQPLGDGLVLASGAGSQLRSGQTVRSYLQDVWTFHPRAGWHHWAALSMPAVAAPFVSDRKEVFIFGGDDGSVPAGAALEEPHHGFQRNVVALSESGVRRLNDCDLPLSLVTTGAALWRGAVIVPGGEDRAGSRSARVLACEKKLLVADED
jgi:N-acetylneuraminic acid mutarotase